MEAVPRAAGAPRVGQRRRRRGVVPLRDAPRIPPTEWRRIRKHLLREGFVVVAGAADARELSRLRHLLWVHLEETTPMRRGFPETWGRTPFPGPARLGLQTWGCVGQSEVMWRARCLPRVGASFEAAWGLEGGAPLLTSFDGLALFRPPQVNPSWATRPALEWLHVDQGSSKRGLVGVQGALLLYDQDESTGGFVCVPRSHERHEQLVPAHKTHDFVQFKPDDARLDGLGDARLVCARAGDLVLWDSRLVHASQPADASAPLPTDDECGGRPRLSRACCMICMVPAAPYVSAQPNLADERRALVEAAATTTHWPQENQVASQGAPGQGVGSVRKLPSEARSLCLGEPCPRRAKTWREAGGWGMEALR